MARCTPSSTPHPTSPALRSGSATFSHKGEKERRVSVVNLNERRVPCESEFARASSRRRPERERLRWGIADLAPQYGGHVSPPAAR